MQLDKKKLKKSSDNLEFVDLKNILKTASAKWGRMNYFADLNQLKIFLICRLIICLHAAYIRTCIHNNIQSYIVTHILFTLLNLPTSSDEDEYFYPFILEFKSIITFYSRSFWIKKVLYDLGFDTVVLKTFYWLWYNK